MDLVGLRLCNFSLFYGFTSEDKIELDKYQERVTEANMQKARDICNESPAKLEEKTVKEDARDKLCDAVKKVRENFLIIGSHGYGTVKRAQRQHLLCTPCKVSCNDHKETSQLISSITPRALAIEGVSMISL